jgi:hypothetical protein
MFPWRFSAKINRKPSLHKITHQTRTGFSKNAWDGQAIYFAATSEGRLHHPHHHKYTNELLR